MLNFASGTWFGIFKLSITNQLTRHLQKQKPGTIGWILFDYPLASDIITTIIAGNC